MKTIHRHMLETKGALARFEREGKLGLAVDHPNVVRTYEVGTHRADAGDVHMLVMEFVEGQTLAELLEREV